MSISQVKSHEQTIDPIQDLATQVARNLVGKLNRDRCGWPASAYRSGLSRVRGEQTEIPLQSCHALHGFGEVDDPLLQWVLHGIWCRNSETAAEGIPGALGLSSSSVSRAFVGASAAKLKELRERDLSRDRYVALFPDGKVFGEATLVLPLRVTRSGGKRCLGFVETDTDCRTDTQDRDRACPREDGRIDVPPCSSTEKGLDSDERCASITLPSTVPLGSVRK
jgi:hypothetical protein